VLDASKEVDIEINAEKSKYMLMSLAQMAGKNHNMKTLNRSSENVAQLKYVGITLTYQNLIKEEIKMGLTQSPTSERCLGKDESATHILCDCEAIACLRFRHLGHYFMEPGDYQDSPVSKTLHFIRGVGLLEG
jgi:hypothetical protein